MERKLVSRLKNDAGLIALVGSSVYAYHAPTAKSNPVVVWQSVSNVKELVIKGRNGHESNRIQFSCYADKLSQARQIADVIRASLDGFKGDMDGLYFLSIWEVSTNDNYLQDDNSHVVYLDFKANYKR